MTVLFWVFVVFMVFVIGYNLFLAFDAWRWHDRLIDKLLRGPR